VNAHADRRSTPLVTALEGRRRRRSAGHREHPL